MLKVEYPDGSQGDIKYLYRDDARDVIMLHDSMDVMMDFYRLRPNDRSTFFVINFAWFVGKEEALAIAMNLNKLSSIKLDALDRILFLSNSYVEEKIFNAYCHNVRNIVVNNCFALSESLFQLQDVPAIYDYAYTARPLEYKKHAFIPKIENSILITNYSEKITVDPEYVDFKKLTPSKVVADIDAYEVCDLLNRSCCGLILSPIEGGCYASAEYLLCGIPVVSTPSLGGRDEYYDEDNVTIVPLDAAAVADAVQKYKRDMTAGVIDRSAIRENFLRRQEFFRRSLASAIAGMTGMENLPFYEYLLHSIQWDSKLWSSIIYWAKGLSDHPLECRVLSEQTDLAPCSGGMVCDNQSPPLLGRFSR